VDKIIADSNVDASVLALKVEKGEIDGVGSGPEAQPVDIQQALADPKYSHYLVNAPTTFVNWLEVNPHIAPLDKLSMRQAIAMAINYPLMVRQVGGAALMLPAHQYYVPAYPQYDASLDQHPVYPYDPKKAAALVKASGYNGQPLTLLYQSHFPGPQLVVALQQDLRQIGINVVLRGVTSATYFGMIGPLKGSALTVSGTALTFADAYDLYAGAMSCGANIVNGYSPAHYCDQVADNMVNKAEGMPLGPARDALIKQAQVHILRAAAHVPLIFPKTIVMVSPKVGGFYNQPAFGWQFENYWLKP
jgi:peptide/nickel transport system substrate-binding protein/oligopeptide transport system substrate-binding protein